MTRGAYYEHFNRRGHNREREQVVVEKVREWRKKLPRSGGRKMHKLTREELAREGIVIGRDSFFKILGKNGLLVKRRKKCPKTTYSGHQYAVQPNLLKQMEVLAPLQVLVADATYIRLERGFCYLFLLTDVYSRKIVGYCLSRTLEHKAAVKALEMAYLEVGSLEGVVHHSDRGVQYCCHEFLKALAEKKMVSSMTDADHCAQNALAERMNGILKDEFYLDMRFVNYEQARRAVEQAVWLYNFERPHLSLHLETPNAFYKRAA